MIESKRFIPIIMVNPKVGGWNDNVKKQLSKVKPISSIQIINEQDIYDILTNKEKLEYLLLKYLEEKNQTNLEKQKLSYKEQQTILKQNKQTIIDFLLENKDSIIIEDLKIYEPIYKCYRTEKGNCHICNTKSNIICINCNNHSWLCTNHWQEHETEKHTLF